ncbi:MAG TPA: hypothetical protein VIT44_13435, partial [Cyclobacteriaceae bacterium]
MKTQHLNFSKAFTGVLLLTICALVSCTSKESTTQKVEASEVKAPEVDIHTAVVTENLEALKQHIAAGTN